jgi:hypothetical protein
VQEAVVVRATGTCPSIIPLDRIDVAVAAPKAGVVRVGLVRVLLVSVCDPANVTTFVASIPLSVNVQVVLETTHSLRSPVTGAVANPKIVFDAVAALPQVVVKFPEAGYARNDPAVPLAPAVTVVEAAKVDAAKEVSAEPSASSA